MARNYNDWLNVAMNHKSRLDQAIADRNSKDILYFRGKYLYDLKQAYKLKPRGIVPASITGSTSSRIETVISMELANHQAHIDKSIRENKQNTSIKSHSMSKELGLKIRRLSTRADQVSFATNTAVKKNAQKELAKDSARLAGTTLLKAPVMATAKVGSKVGPLAVTIFFLPAKVVNTLLAVTIDVYRGKVKDDMSEYNNTIVDQISGTLKDAIKTVSKHTYETVGRI